MDVVSAKRQRKLLANCCMKLRGRQATFLQSIYEGSLCCKWWLNVLVKKRNIYCFFICQPCRFSPVVDEWAGECLQVAPRIVNYLCSSVRIINYFLVFTVAETAQTQSFRKLQEFSELAIRKNIFSLLLNRPRLIWKAEKVNTSLIFHKVTLESLIMF